MLGLANISCASSLVGASDIEEMESRVDEMGQLYPLFYSPCLVGKSIILVALSLASSLRLLAVRSEQESNVSWSRRSSWIFC